MDDAACRKDVLKTARSLIKKDGSSFTVAALCKKTRLSRTQMRRIFPTKAALLCALDTEIVAEPPIAAEAEAVQENNTAPLAAQDAEIVVEPPAPAETESVQENKAALLAKQDAEVTEHPAAAETKPVQESDDWIERRLRVLQRAIGLLEVRIDAISAEQAHYASSREGEATKSAVPVASQPPELPPLAIAGHGAEQVIDAPEIEGCDASREAFTAPEPALPPVIDGFVPNSRPVAPDIVRGMLDNARALAKTAAENNIQHEKSEQTSTMLTLIGAAAIVIVGLIVGLVSVGGTARAKRTSFGTASETLAHVSGITIINATGAVVVDQMTPAARAMTARAEKGDAGAQAELAMAYLRGDGVVSDPVAAVGWAGLAASKGQPLGQFILGTLYNSGIKPDPRSGFRWMSAAALNGDVKAMHNVAVALVSGSGIEKDPVEAANWFNKAASLGYRDSAFDLAVLYERGEGVAQSTQRALYWYDNAAATGDKEAAKRASLLRFGVPEIADNLDPSKRNRVSRLQ